MLFRISAFSTGVNLLNIGWITTGAIAMAKIRNTISTPESHSHHRRRARRRTPYAIHHEDRAEQAADQDLLSLIGEEPPRLWLSRP